MDRKSDSHHVFIVPRYFIGTAFRLLDCRQLEIAAAIASLPASATGIFEIGFGSRRCHHIA
jgi:hypothetical protein